MFEAAGSRASLEQKIESALEAEFGFEVTTFVRTATELGRVLEVEPFPVAGERHLLRHVPQGRPERVDRTGARGLVQRLRHARRRGARGLLAHARQVERHASQEEGLERRRRARQHEPQHHDAAQARHQARPAVDLTIKDRGQALRPDALGLRPPRPLAGSDRA